MFVQSEGMVKYIDQVWPEKSSSKFRFFHQEYLNTKKKLFLDLLREKSSQVCYGTRINDTTLVDERHPGTTLRSPLDDHN